MLHQPFRLALTSFIIAGFALHPAVAEAWDPDLLCVYPEPAAERDVLGSRPAIAEPTEPLMCAPDPSEAAGGALPLTLDHARDALDRARRLAAAGRSQAAILALRRVAAATPELADRIALEEADIRMAAGADEATCAAFSRATESPHRSVAALAEVGLVRCQLTIGDRRGVAGLESLRRRYAELPQEQELAYLLGRAHEGWGDGAEAGRLYRALDLTSPGSPWAREARARIDALVREGVTVRPLTMLQEVERAERLVRGGPMDLARDEIARLRRTELPRPLAMQVAHAAARIARVEGRFDAAAALLREAQGAELDEEEREAMAARTRELEAAAQTREQDEVRRRIRSQTRGRPLSRQPTARVFAVLRMAARADLRDVVDEALRALLDNSRLPPGLAFEAGIIASGTGDDEHVAALFARASRHPSYDVAGLYHHARALERLGRVEEARAELRRVIAEDSRSLPFYALWARQRLRATAHVPTRTPQPMAAIVPAAIECRAGPFTAFPDELAGKVGMGERRSDVSCIPPPAPNPFVAAPETEVEEVATERDGLIEAHELALALEARGGSERGPDPLATEEVVALLRSLSTDHAEGFPWFERARVLVELGETAAATDELHEAFTAWRDATRGGSLRAGVEGVMRGAAPPRHRVSQETWRARRRLPNEARQSLGRVSAALGDYGLAIKWSGSFSYTGTRPRPHAQIVEAAARRHGIEPELLFAVMRVESVYNPRIISYAGAIGLMQIMPRTGRLIASAMDLEGFTVDRLLEPEVNIDMAAWYLASLIERFEGRIPLAIASYNGGPHNVRRWLSSYSDEMPLDAFLEQIEFSQTHRYVRRVLTHYEAYRAQRSAPMARLDVHLPDLEPDRVAF